MYHKLPEIRQHDAPRTHKCDRTHSSWRSEGRRMKHVAKDADAQEQIKEFVDTKIQVEELAECTHPNQYLYIKYVMPWHRNIYKCPDCGETWAGMGLFDYLG